MIYLSPEAAEDLERVREFLDINNPEAAKRALRTIFAALDRVEAFPDLGRPTEDADIRQIVIPFGAAGYIVRYTALARLAPVARARSAGLISDWLSPRRRPRTSLARTTATVL